MYEFKNWIWGALVLCLASLILWLHFDFQAFDANLLLSDSSRDLLIADHLLSFKESWLIAPVNSSSFLPSIPTYYWLVALMYAAAGMQLQIFFVYYLIWLALCSLFVFFSLNHYGSRFNAFIATGIFTVIFSHGFLTQTLFQPIFALPFVFFFLFYVSIILKEKLELFNLSLLLIFIAFITTIHYSNLVLLILVPLLILVGKKKFSKKYLFFGVVGVLVLTLVGFWTFHFDSLLKSFELIILSGQTYFHFSEIAFFLFGISFGLLHFVSFVKKNDTAANFFFLSLAMFYVVVFTAPLLTGIGIEPRAYHVLTSVLASFFFSLQGFMQVFTAVKVNKSWQLIAFCLVAIGVILKVTTSTPLKRSDLKATNAFLVAEFLAHRYFVSQIPFSISVSHYCGDTSLGNWFSGGVWLFFEKITGEAPICLQPLDSNFRECFTRSTSQKYLVCKDFSSDFTLSNTLEQVFKTPEGWYVFVLP